MKNLFKNKKIASLLSLSAFFTILTGCGSSSDTTKETVENKETTQETTSNEDTSSSEGTLQKFEAEYTDLSNVVGGGISGAASGLNMIAESSDASNGFYIYSTHSTDCVITFKITASESGTGTLRLVLGNELAAMEMSPNTLGVIVNNTAFEYTAFTLPKEEKTTGKTFKTYKIGDIQLNAGENTIALKTENIDGSNKYCNGGPGGALYDCITIKSTLNLTMEEHTDNIE